MAYFQADYDAAKRSYTESLAICRNADYSSGKIVALSNLATVHMDGGALEEASALFVEALVVVRATGDLGREAVVLYNLGNLAHWRHDLVKAAQLHSESLRIRSERGDTRGIALSHTALGILAMEAGDFGAAHTHFLDSLRLQRDLDDKWRISDTLANLARALEGLQQDEQATRLRGASEAMRRALDTPFPDSRQTVWDKENAILRARLGDTAFAAAWETGAASTPADIVSKILD